MTGARISISRCSTRKFLRHLDRLTARDITITLAPVILTRLVGDARRAGASPEDMVKHMVECQYRIDPDDMRRRHRDLIRKATGRTP